MSEPGWTPGPWSIFHDFDGHFLIEHPQGGLNICRTYFIDGQAEERDNAHLIAAAPELYNALEQARIVIVLLVKSFPQDERLADYTAILDDAEQADLAATAALAKARGESQ